MLIMKPTMKLRIDQLEAENKFLKKQLSETQNIEKQHQYVNGLLHKEVAKLNKEIDALKKENAIFKENLQAELLRKK